MLKFIVAVIMSWWTLVAVSGCGSSLFNEHIKQGETLRAMAVATGSQLQEGTGQFSGAANGVNPGIRLSAGTEYYAEARYVGVGGQFSFAKQGSTVALTEADKARVQEILSNTSMSDAERQAAILAIVKGIANRVSTSQPSN